ncbi:MAG: Gldg family protein [Gammaproteobacteria bacterium]|nr:Gldg family protein [Gammaproteobacteria bacterium]
MHSRLLTTSVLILAAVLLLAVNVVSNNALSSARIDLTENELYTLSIGTKNVLEQIEEPISLRLFLTEEAATRLPVIGSYANRVRELLDEYQRYSNGKLLVTLIDPEPFSEDEDRAVSFGLQGIPLGDGNSILYFGLVGTNSLDDQEVISFFSIEREQFLEYDLTKLIYQLANPKQMVVGLMSSLPVDGGVQPGGGFSRPWMVIEQLRQLFEVRTIAMDVEQIDEEVNVLVLVHPKALSESASYAVEQFVLAGGRAVVFVDPYAEADQTGGFAGAPGGSSSEFDDLLNAWGLDLVPGKVAGDLRLALTVRAAQDARNPIVEYPVWMNIPPQLMDPDDIVTARLGDLVLATPGILTTRTEKTTEIKPLLTTSDNAMEIDSGGLGFDADLEDLLRRYQPGGKSLTLAVRVTGPVESIFPKGAPPAESGDVNDEDQLTEQTNDTPRVHLASSQEDVNLIVVADTDLLQDQFWVTVQNFLGTEIALPQAANGAFVVNAVDNLTGSNDLISVRNRGNFARPFDRVQEIRQDAELRFRAKEQDLLNRLDQTEQRLVSLESGKTEKDTLILSEAQQQEITKFREEKVQIRKDLRDVRHRLDQDIQRLETTLKFVNIGLVPILIVLSGMAVSAWQVRRRKHALSGTHRKSVEPPS